MSTHEVHPLKGTAPYEKIPHTTYVEPFVGMGHYLAFVEMLRWQLTTTDLERAARFFYLQKNAFGGKVTGRQFGVSPGERAAFDVTRIIPELEAYHERLAGVVVERLPYAECLARYDRPATLFFLDPPYFGTEKYYGKDLFSRADFERLADQLAQLQGRFILTINEHAETRRIFGRFKVRSHGLHYGVGGGGKTKKVRELVVQSR